jgi:hypothetical protein
MCIHRRVAFFALIGLAVAEPSVSTPDLRAEDKEITVTAKKLAEKYATDPADFDKTYKDKVVEVEGVVETPKATETISNKNYVMLHGYTKKGDSFPTMVRCELSKELEGIKAGAKVTVRGTCRAHNKFVAAAEITNCKLLGKK